MPGYRISFSVAIAPRHGNTAMQSEEKKEDWLGTLGTKECHGGAFPGLSFCLIYPRLGGEEANDLEMPKEQTKKDPTKGYSLQPKDQERGIPARKETLDYNQSTPAKHRRKKGDLHPHQQRPSGKPRFSPLPYICCHRHPQ